MNSFLGTKFLRTLAAVSVAATFAANAHAATVTYAVEGDAGGSQVITRDQAVAQSFLMNQTLTDASITFDVLCYACSGDIYLITGRPKIGAFVSQFETMQAYTINGNATLGLSGRMLEANQLYTLIWSVFEGDGFWRASNDPVGAGDAASFDLSSWSQDVDQGYPANSSYITLNSTAKFSITGTAEPSPIPLPASLPAFLSALLCAGIIGRRMQKT